MPDDALTPILRRLETTHQPDPRFASELFTTLRPLALDAGQRDMTFLGRLRDWIAERAANVAGPPTSHVRRLAFVVAVAALIIGLVAALVGRAPARPFVHDASFGTFMIELDGDVATATAMRGVLAASPSGAHILVDRREPSDPSLAIVATDTGQAEDLPSEPGEVSAVWSTDDRLAWAVRPMNVDAPASAIHVARPGQGTILAWEVPHAGGTSRTGVDSFAWSPDGRQLAVATGEDGLADHLYLVDAATAVGRELGDGLRPVQFAWSPDGRSIAVLLEDTFDPATNDSELVGMDASTGHRTPLGRSETDVVWLADGSLLVTGQGSLWRVDPDRKDRHLLATSPDLGGRLFPSPDRSMLAFMGGGTAPNLWTVPTAGGSPRLLADGLWYRWRPAWSPDGRWILFTRGPVSGRSLWMIRPDGSGRQEVVPPGVLENASPTIFAGP